MSVPPAGLLDTSVFVGTESGRALDPAKLPERSFVCVVTLAELQVGVLAAKDPATRSRRLETLTSLGVLDLLEIDAAVAANWASLRVAVAQAGRRVNVNDLWIAAVAQANDLPVISQATDFEVIAEVGGPAWVRV